jgi:hypothetical protein
MKWVFFYKTESNQAHMFPCELALNGTMVACTIDCRKLDLPYCSLNGNIEGDKIELEAEADEQNLLGSAQLSGKCLSANQYSGTGVYHDPEKKKVSIEWILEKL